jgi:hypothetical protein
MPGGFTGTL